MIRRAQLHLLEARIAEIRRMLQDLETRHEELLLRAAVLSLLERTAAEADAHSQRFGVPPLLRGPGLPGEDEGERGRFAADCQLAPTELEESIDFLRPGRSLLGLERVTAEEVEAVRALTPEAARRRFAQAVAHACAATAACAAPPPAEAATPRSAAAAASRSPPCHHTGGGAGSCRTTARLGGACPCICAGAELAFVPGPERAEAAAAGRDVRHLHVLLGLWNQPALFHICSHDMERGHPCCGNKDATPTHWDAVLRAARLSREQALLLRETLLLMEARSMRLKESRGTLCSEVAAGASQGATAVGAIAVGAAAGGEQAAAELVLSVRCEMAVRVAHILVSFVVLGDIAACLMYARSWPVPINSTAFNEAVRLALTFEPEALPPWARHPERDATAREAAGAAGRAAAAGGATAATAAPWGAPAAEPTGGLMPASSPPPC